MTRPTWQDTAPITPEADAPKTIHLVAGIPQPWRRIIEKLIAERDALSARVAELEAERDHWQASQHYTYIGKDGKPVLARDLEDRAEAAESKLAKAVAPMRGAVIEIQDYLADNIGTRALEEAMDGLQDAIAEIGEKP